MSDTNKHGLSRYIPAEIERAVRVRSKFGCVFCRSAIYQYEHITPEFSDATEHNSDNICLLCGRCHDKVNKGQISKDCVRRQYETVQKAAEVRPPFDDFVLDTRRLTVVLGSSIFHGAKTLIEIDGEAVLAIEPPEDGASFPTISGEFSDEKGKELFRIDKNIWSGKPDAWDMKVEGKEITIRSAPRKVALKLIVEPPNKIVVEHLDMRSGNAFLRLRKGSLEVGRIESDAEYSIGFERFECDGAETGVKVDSLAVKEPTLKALNMVGGKGVALEGTGIYLGVGTSRMTILGLSIEHATRQHTKRMTFPLREDMKGYTQVLPPRIS
ncbi:HNH endonuclease [Marinobacter lacisalsi]|uniref:HNH endonuclease n=1 Tax=Marinobacter lacisalsi TaxID=475979 RepID=A0ABV8QJS7_9GAMM